MKILSIGNSFSQDAQRYLSRVSAGLGEKLFTANLYIGGCSLETHYNNMVSDASAYRLEINGEATAQMISIKAALLSEKWDFVTLQQVSHLSASYETYNPYLETLADLIRVLCPEAKILIHETWAYEDNSERLLNVAGFKSAEEMLSAVQKAYEMAALDIKAHGIIRCGEAMMNALKFGANRVHRDTFHASLGLGRYILALCWYKAIFGNDISKDCFCDFDEPVSDEERMIAIQAAEATAR